MSVSAGYLTPCLGVADVERSLRFYALLGFQTVDVEHEKDTVTWARAHCEGGAIMFLRRDSARRPNPFVLYLYTPDLPAFRAQLVSVGVDVGPIEAPDHMPGGELTVTDPDGNMILVGHWPEEQHQEWLRSLEAKRAAGLIP